MLHADVPLTLLAQAAGAMLAALLAAAGWRAYARVRAGALLRFGAGFAALALAQAAAAALEGLASSAGSIPTRGAGVHDVLFWTYYGALLMGLGFLLSTFDRRKLRLVLAAGPVLLVAGPVAQLAAVALLFLVVVHAGLNHIERARAGSFLTTGGFFLLLAAHALFLAGYAPLTPRNPAGEALNLLGLLLLCLAARPRRDR